MKTKKPPKRPRGPIQGPPPAVFSFGGGVQSMAALVLAAQGKLPYRYFVFADVGADSEHPATMVYLETVARPFAERHGLRLVVVQKLRKDGSFESILEKLHRTQTSIDIPVRMQNGAPGNRSCTADYKVKPVAKWMKAHGATVANPGRVAIGISTDEWIRVKPSQIPFVVNEHPLIDLDLSREDCLALIREAGVKDPPKSACWFCPFHTPAAWLEMRETEPELFARSVELEAMVNRRRRRLAKYAVFLTRFAKPLDEAIVQYVAELEVKRAAAEARERRSQGKGKKRLPIGWEALLLFDTSAQERQNCGPFTCEGDATYDPADPFAGIVTKRIA